MKKEAQNPKKWDNRGMGYLFMLMAFCWSLFLPDLARGQTKTVASNVEALTENKPGIWGRNQPTVQNPGNASSDNGDYARVWASPGVLLGGGSYTGKIELRFSNPVPANQWSYVRIGANDGLLRVLLAGSLGNTLGTVVGGLLLGNQEFEVDVLDGTTSRLKRSNTEGFTTDRVRLVLDGQGNTYIAVRPAYSYDRIHLTNRSISAIGLGAQYTLDVYSAVTYGAGGTNCGRPFFTSFDGGSGIGLTVADFDDQHLNRAIDADPNSYSLLKSTGVLDLSVAREFSQYFYFPTTSSENHSVNIKLDLGSGGAINTDLLGGIEVVFTKWNTTTAEYDVVYRRSLQSSLLNNTDALALLQSGQPITATFGPGRAFDRLEIKLNSTLGLSLLGNGVRIYDVQRYSGVSGCINPELGAVPAATPGPLQTPSCATSLIDFDNVDFAHKAVDGNNETFATLHADAGGLLVSGPTSGWIEMDMGAVLPANRTTYVRINYDEDVLNTLLGGSLGKLVTDLANNLLLGNQYFQIEAKNGASTTVLDRRSSNGFEGASYIGNGTVTLVQDNIGRFYLAITPDADYDRIRISNHVVALLATGKKASLDVYNACFELGTDVCFPANFTSYTGSGLNLSVGDISEAKVVNPYRAISANSSEYSEISLGVAAIGAQVFQSVYFNHPSQIGDYVKVRLAAPPSVLALDAIGNYQIRFFNGDQQVEEHVLSQGLINNLDLLALFQSGGAVTLEFTPAVVFDRVDIGIQSVLSASLATPTLRLYNVSRHGVQCPEVPGVSPFDSPVCATSLLAAHNADDVQYLFDDDFDSFAVLNSGAGTLLGLFGSNKEGFVEMGYDHTVPAGTTSYIRIDFDQDILNGLLGGSLGNVVSSLVNGLLLGDHFFEVDVKNNNAPVVSASSATASAGGNDAIRVVRDAQGRYYIAVTPDQPYTSIRITAKTAAAVSLLATPNTMHVYGMCYDASTDVCLDAFATSYEYTGLSLSVNDLGAAGVTNPHYAINGNPTQYSEISNGTLGVGTSTKQWIFFNSMSKADDVTTISFRTQANVATVDILGNLVIQAYAGNDLVHTLDWGTNGLINGINVLQLVQNAQPVNLPYTPGVPYDRISIGVKTLVGVEAFPALRVYNVQRECTEPRFVAWKSFEVDGDPAIKTVQGGETVEYTIHVRNTGAVPLVDFTVTDVIPAYTTYVAGSADTDGGAYDNGTNTLTFSGVHVGVGETETLTFSVAVDADLTAVPAISNVALVKENPTDTGTETFPPDSADPNEPDDSGDTGTDIPVDAVIDVTTWKGYSIANGPSTTTVRGGEQVTYTIYIRNNGNQDLTGVEVVDKIPAGTAFVSATNSGAVNGNNEVVFENIDIAVGAMVSVSFTVDVANNLTGLSEISNVAFVDYGGTTPKGTVPPADPANPADGPDAAAMPGTPTIIPVTDNLSVVAWKSYKVDDDASVTSVKGGEIVEYTIHVRNTGNKQLTGVVIADELPADVTHVSGGTLDGNIVRFGATTPITIGFGQTVTRTFSVKVNTDLTGVDVISNIATVTGTGILTPVPTTPPLDNENPTDPSPTPGPTDIPVADDSKVTFTKVGEDATGLKKITAGQTLTYTLTVENTGNKALTGVTITDPMDAIPDYFEDQVEVNGVLQTVVGGTGITHIVGNLEVGESATITIQVTAQAALLNNDPIVNIATVTYTKEGNTTVSETATETVLSDCDPVSAADIVVALVGAICAGEQVELDAALAAGSALPAGADFVWRRGSDSGPIVHTGETYTPTLTTAGTHTFYVSIEGGRACFQTPGKVVTVTVNPRATASDITTTDDALCEGGSVDLSTLVSSTVAEATFKYYADAALTTELPSNTVTPAVGTHVYYVTVSGTNICENAPNTAAQIVVTVSPRAVATDIAAQNETICEGDEKNLVASLAPGVAIDNPVFRWYTDADLTTLVHTGASFTPSPALTVSTTYYLTVSGTGICENLPAEAKEVTVTVTPRGKAEFILIDAPAEICEGDEVTFTASLDLANPANPSIVDPVFKWYTDATLSELVYEGAEFTIIADANFVGTHTLYVTVEGVNYCPNAIGSAKTHGITVHEMPVITLPGGQTNYAVPVNSVLDLSGYTVTPGTATVTWYDENNTVIPVGDVAVRLANISFATEGTYTFRVTAENGGGCTTSEIITITVFDPDNCPPEMQRVYASSQSWASAITGGVSNAGQAVDGNVKTYSTLTTGVGLLGIGTVWQNLNFGHIVPAGTPVTIKLGKEYSGLMLAGGITVVGLNDNATIGPLRGVQGGILDLLNSDNVVEFTFVPTDGSGIPQPYTGVRVVQGALVSVAQNARLYGAYYTIEGAVDCDPIDSDTNKDILDLYHGVRDIGLGVASSLATVKDPWRAVDNDPNTFAEMWAGAGILNQGFITPVFKSRSMPTDSLHITLAIPGQPVLSLSLLTNIKIQRYLGNTKVGAEIRPLDQNILGLRLLGLMGDGSQKAVLTIAAGGLVYDRVDIAYDKFVSVLGDFVNIYDVAVAPKIANVYDGSMNFELCPSDNLQIQMQDACTTYEVYDQSGTPLVTTDNLNFELPSGIQPGTYTFKVQAMRFGCAVGPLEEITVVINEMAVIDAAGQPQDQEVAAGAEASFTVDVSNAASIQATYQWEVSTDDGGTWTAIDGVANPSAVASTLTVLVPADQPVGKMAEYRVQVSSDEGCDVFSAAAVLNVVKDYGLDDDAIVKAGQNNNENAVAGREYTYTVTVENKGPSTILNGTTLYFRDIVSSGQTIQSVDFGGVHPTVGMNGRFDLQMVNDITAGATFSFDVTVLVDAAAPDKISNTVYIWQDDPQTDVDNPDGIAETPEIDVDRDYGFDDDAIAKVGQHGNENAIAGTPYTYTVTVENQGPSTILHGTTLYFHDVVSPGQTLQSVTYAGNTQSLGADGLFSLAVNGPLEAGDSFTFDVAVLVAADAPATIKNEIQLWQDNPGTDINNLATPDATGETPPINVDRDYGFDDDAINKEGNGGAVAGEAYTYTVTVENQGPSIILAGTPIYFRDVIGTGQTLQSVSYAGVTQSLAANGLFHLEMANDVAVNATFTFNVTVMVDSDAPTFISNKIQIWQNNPGTDPDNLSTPDGEDETDPIPVDRVSKVSITKVADQPLVKAGEETTFTLTITNVGPSVMEANREITLKERPGTGVTITGYQIVSGSGTVQGTGNDAIVTTTGKIALGETIVVRVTAMVSADAPATIKNGVAAWGPDTPTADNPDDEDETPGIDVDRESKVSITKIADEARVTAGEETTFTLTITNVGPSVMEANREITVKERPGTGVTITGYQIVSGSGTIQGTGNDAVITTTDKIALGETIVVRVTAMVDEDAPDKITNGVAVWGPDTPTTDDPDDEDETPEIDVDRITDLSIEKTVNNYRPLVGSNVVFTVVVTNNGPSAATGVVVTDELPSGYEYVSSTATVGTFANNAWTVGNLANGASATLTITAQVLAAGDYINYASVTGDNEDQDTDNNEDTPDDPVVPVPVSDLAIHKTVDNYEPLVGSNVLFTVVVTNNGPSAATGVVVTDELPSGYEYVSSTATVGTFANNAWTVGNLANGASATLTITARVLSAGDYTNYASVTGDNEDPDTDNNEDRPDDDVVPVPVSDLAIHKTVDNYEPLVGSNVVFTVVVTNNGPSAATGVVVTDELPSGYEYVSSTATVGTFANNAWTVGNLANGASATLTITARVLSAGDYTNYASVTGDNEDPDTDNNEDRPEDDVVPVPVSDLAIHKTVDNYEPLVGSNVVFTVVVTNNGPSAGTGVVVTDELPSGYEYVSSAATVGTFANNAWTVGNLANGASATLTITARVLAAGDYTNYASVTGDNEDPDTDNNEDRPDDDVVPVPVHELSIMKVADQARVVAGEQTTFTLTITNEGPSPIKSGSVITLKERPSAGVTVTGYTVASGAATITGSANDAQITTTGEIAQGGTVVVRVTAMVDANAPAKITNGIAVWGPNKPITEDPDDEDETPEVDVDRVSVMSITKVADEARVKEGESTTFTVTITNDGPSAIAVGKAIRLEELPGEGIRITGYQMLSNNATIVGTENTAMVTTTAVIPVGGNIIVSVEAEVEESPDTPETITNGIRVWGPDKPTTEDPDDEDETEPVPVDLIRINAVDDFAETKAAVSVTIDVLENDIAESAAIDPTSIEIVTSSPGATIEILSNGQIVYTPSRDQIGEDTFTYRVRDVNGRWSNIATVTVNILPNDLVIPTIITPNGDGRNDRLVIGGREMYDRISVTIINRWGNEVYRNDNYQDEWEGRGLNDGTYFISVKAIRGSSTTDVKSTVLIKRN